MTLIFRISFCFGLFICSLTPLVLKAASIGQIVSRDISNEISAKLAALANQSSKEIRNPIELDQGILLVREHVNLDATYFSGELNRWDKLKMSRSGRFDWLYIEAASIQPQNNRYKFIVDGRYQSDPLASYFSFDRFGEMSHLNVNASQYTLKRIWSVPSDAVLPSRWIYVFIPPHAAPYDVMIMHDGQNLFHPGPNSLNLPQELQHRKNLPLIVGVENSANRMEEYTFTTDLNSSRAMGDKYLDYVMNEVLSTVRSQFKTTDYLGMMGTSLGGLISLYASLRYSSEINFVASLSGTLGWGSLRQNNPTIFDLFAQTPSLPNAGFYTDSGGGPGLDGQCYDQDGDGLPEDDPDDSDNYCANQAFYNLHSRALNISYRWYENARHHESAWKLRMNDIFDAFSINKSHRRRL